MSVTWTNPWYMAGTEGTGEYVVVAYSTIARIGYRQVARTCRIRVEPAGRIHSQLARHLTTALGWKQPGDGGENRYSIVVQREQLPQVLLSAIRAAQGELPPIINPGLPGDAWLADIVRQSLGERPGETGENVPGERAPADEPKSRAKTAKRDQVFISYSHQDKRWLDDLEKHLKPYVRAGSITAWSDKQLKAGSKWFEEIILAMRRTKVAVLLVTSDFLASDFIHEHELSPFLKEAEAGGVTILWIPVRASSFQMSPIKDYQSLIEPNKPLAEMKAERDSAWVRICKEIGRAVGG